jgi:hypothetical protein
LTHHLSQDILKLPAEASPETTPATEAEESLSTLSTDEMATLLASKLADLEDED